MNMEIRRLPLPDPDEDGHPLDWFPEPEIQPVGLPGRLTETSYTLPENLNIGQWLAIGETLQRMERSVMWWLGDWWRYGERSYGDLATQAAKDALKDKTGHAYGTIANAAYVAGKFEISRRREDLPFSHHQEVAPLPPDDADALLVEAEANGWNRAEIREQAQERKQVIAVDSALSAPAPDPLFIPQNVRIEVADARSMPLADNSVNLIITSPPYGVGRPYAGDGDVAAGDWPGFMHDWMLEAFRVSADHGRLALNVPLDTTRGGFRPTYAQAIQMADAAGWTYRSTIVWFDDQLGKSVARGSVDSAGAPYVYAGAEMIALFSRGEWKREAPDVMPPGVTLSHQDWLSWTNGVWRQVGETQAWEGHPAPFPYEIPRRLALLLSFPGDVVLDPFCGSGTVSLIGRLGRDVVCFDKSPLYVKSTQRRAVTGRAVA